jgi:hypothetical protein
MSTRLDAWLASAIEDAERRGLPELKLLLEGLARTTAALREADSEYAREIERKAAAAPPGSHDQ